MKMFFRKIILLVVNLFIISSLNANQKYELKLSQDEEKDLRNFVENMMWNSEWGYVLYGDKPISFGFCISGCEDSTGALYHHCSTSINQGLNIWKKLDLPNLNSKYLFVLNEYDAGQCTHSTLVLINKEKFTEVFNNHSVLFRYVLGPDITAEKLINAIKNSYDNFSFILKNDDVLIGLLLGFGLENSLYVSRKEKNRGQLESNITFSSHFPFEFLLAKRFHYTMESPPPPFRPLSMLPSIGYSSLEEELEDLENQTEIASTALEEYSPNLIFGKVSDPAKSDKKLIKDYEDTQLKIIKIMEEDKWLEKVLSDLCYCDITLRLYENDSLKKDHWSDSKEISQTVAQAIYLNVERLFGKNAEEDFSQFIEGMHAAESKEAVYVAPFVRNQDLLSQDNMPFREGFIQWSHYKLNNGLFSLQAVVDLLTSMKKNKTNVLHTDIQFDLLKKLQARNFHHLNEHENLIAQKSFTGFEQGKMNVKALVKGRLYYESKRPGTGPKVDGEHLVKVAYTLKSIYGNVVEDHSEGKFIDLKRSIRGFREGLSTMNVGEKGVLYIHPDWGWKNHLVPPYFSPYLIAEFEIISN